VHLANLAEAQSVPFPLRASDSRNRRVRANETRDCERSTSRQRERERSERWKTRLARIIRSETARAAIRGRHAAAYSGARVGSARLALNRGAIGSSRLLSAPIVSDPIFALAPSLSSAVHSDFRRADVRHPRITSTLAFRAERAHLLTQFRASRAIARWRGFIALSGFIAGLARAAGDETAGEEKEK